VGIVVEPAVLNIRFVFTSNQTVVEYLVE